MPCLGLPEEVEFDVHSDGPDIDDGEDQEEARELISPFLADEHYLEEPASIQGSIVSTEDATDQFQRGWRVDRRAGDSWMYVEDNDSLFVSERVDDVASPIPPILSPGRIIDAEYRDIDGEVDANGPNGDEERERRFLEWMNESENTDIGQDNGTQLQDQEHQYDGQDNSQQQPLSPDTDGNDDVHPRQAPDISPASLPPSSASIPATEDQREHDALSGVGDHGDVDTGNEESAQAMIALEAWEARDSPFKTSNFEKLSAEVLKFDDRSMMNESKIVLKTRRDFAEEMFVALMEGGRKGHPGVETIAPTHSTWPSILRAAIQHTRGSFATRAQWVSGIAAAMVSASIEWVPGSHRRRLTHQQVVQLVGAAASATVLAARPDSLKRRALEAEAR
ncbi:hypothetical protein RAB80_018201, partial [Fusarium oxysporum f. sp. vasinfectum]